MGRSTLYKMRMELNLPYGWVHTHETYATNKTKDTFDINDLCECLGRPRKESDEYKSWLAQGRNPMDGLGQGVVYENYKMPSGRWLFPLGVTETKPRRRNSRRPIPPSAQEGLWWQPPSSTPGLAAPSLSPPSASSTPPMPGGQTTPDAFAASNTGMLPTGMNAFASAGQGNLFAPPASNGANFLPASKQADVNPFSPFYEGDAVYVPPVSNEANFFAPPVSNEANFFAPPVSNEANFFVPPASNQANFFVPPVSNEANFFVPPASNGTQFSAPVPPFLAPTQAPMSNAGYMPAAPLLRRVPDHGNFFLENPVVPLDNPAVLLENPVVPLDNPVVPLDNPVVPLLETDAEFDMRFGFDTLPGVPSNAMPPAPTPLAAVPVAQQDADFDMRFGFDTLPDATFDDRLPQISLDDVPVAQQDADFDMRFGFDTLPGVTSNDMPPPPPRTPLAAVPVAPQDFDVFAGFAPATSIQPPAPVAQAVERGPEDDWIRELTYLDDM